MFLGKSAGGAATATQTKAIRNCSQTSSLQTLDLAITLKLRILKKLTSFFGFPLRLMDVRGGQTGTAVFEEGI